MGLVYLLIAVVIGYVCWPNLFGWSWGNFPYTMASDPQEKVLQEILRQRSLEFDLLETCEQIARLPLPMIHSDFEISSINFKVSYAK